MLSRITGLGRDISMAAAFGGAPAVAAFFVAFRFAHLFRRLLGEGAFQAAFIPHFERLRGEDPAKAKHFYRDLWFALTLALFLIVLTGEGIIYLLLTMTDPSPSTREILLLTGKMLPSLIFVCSFGLNMGLLQCENHYFLSGIAPAAMNVVCIGATFLLWDTPTPVAMQQLALFVVMGLGLQWSLTLPTTLKYLRGNRPVRLTSPEIMSMIKAMGLSAIGVGAAQINSALDAVFARLADPSGPVYLWYSIRMQQLPLALFGLSMMGALLPSISRRIKAQDREGAAELFTFSFRKSFAVMVICTGGIFAFGLQGIDMLFGHRDFSALDSIATSLCLEAYGLGLIPMALAFLLAAVFYAHGDYVRPMQGALLAFASNLALNSFFIFALGWGAVSIALATSLSALAQACYLSYEAHKRYPAAWLKGCGTYSLKCVCTVLLALCLNKYLIAPSSLHAPLSEQIVNFLIPASLYVASCAIFAWLLRSEDVLKVLSTPRSNP